MRFATMLVVLSLGIGSIAHAQDAAAAKTPAAKPNHPPTSFSILKSKVAERQQKIRKALDDDTVFEFIETPLSDVVEFLGELHSMPIMIDRKALDDMGIGTDTTISANMRGVSLRSALKIVLNELDLTYAIRNEVMMITTPEEAEAQLTNRLYPAGDLVARQSSAVVYRDSSRGDSIRELVQEMVAPDSWDEVGGPGAITWVDHLNVFVISQTDPVHDEVEALFESIREIKNRLPKADGANRVAPQQNQMLVKIYKLQNPAARGGARGGFGFGAGGFGGGGFGGVGQAAGAASGGQADPFAPEKKSKPKQPAVDPFGGDAPGADPFSDGTKAKQDKKPSDDPFAPRQPSKGEGGDYAKPKKRPVDPFGDAPGADPFGGATKKSQAKRLAADPFGGSGGATPAKNGKQADPFGGQAGLGGQAAPAQPAAPAPAAAAAPRPGNGVGNSATPRPRPKPPKPLDTKALAELVKSTIEPTQWTNDAVAIGYEGQLIVRQTESVHQQIRQLLLQLDLLRHKHSTTYSVPVVGGGGLF